MTVAQTASGTQEGSARSLDSGHEAAPKPRHDRAGPGIPLHRRRQRRARCPSTSISPSSTGSSRRTTTSRRTRWSRDRRGDGVARGREASGARVLLSRPLDDAGVRRSSSRTRPTPTPSRWTTRSALPSLGAELRRRDRLPARSEPRAMKVDVLPPARPQRRRHPAYTPLPETIAMTFTMLLLRAAARTRRAWRVFGYAGERVAGRQRLREDALPRACRSTTASG